MKIAIVGQQGSGKSLLTMVIARQIQKKYPEIKIYTNINALGNNLIVINDLGDLPFDRTPKILIVDEMMFSANARSSSTNENLLWTMALAYFRKSNVILTMYATHRVSMIDKNIREQLDSIIMCRKNSSMFQYLYIDMTTYHQIPMYMPKIKEVFDFADYDTYDFPMPIKVHKLMDNPMFELTKVERTKYKSKKQLDIEASV
jgi:ABC-type dipeptide/oligopeptide/nickel transport system ATPase component